jgi:hypothetical protein
VRVLLSLSPHIEELVCRFTRIRLEELDMESAIKRALTVVLCLSLFLSLGAPTFHSSVSNQLEPYDVELSMSTGVHYLVSGVPAPPKVLAASDSSGVELFMVYHPMITSESLGRNWAFSIPEVRQIPGQGVSFFSGTQAKQEIFQQQGGAQPGVSKYSDLFARDFEFIQAQNQFVETLPNGTRRIYSLVSATQAPPHLATQQEKRYFLSEIVSPLGLKTSFQYQLSASGEVQPVSIVYDLPDDASSNRGEVTFLYQGSRLEEIAVHTLGGVHHHSLVFHFSRDSQIERITKLNAGREQSKVLWQYSYQGTHMTERRGLLGKITQWSYATPQRTSSVVKPKLVEQITYRDITNPERVRTVKFSYHTEKNGHFGRINASYDDKLTQITEFAADLPIKGLVAKRTLVDHEGDPIIRTRNDLQVNEHGHLVGRNAVVSRFGKDGAVAHFASSVEHDEYNRVAKVQSFGQVTSDQPPFTVSSQYTEQRIGYLEPTNNKKDLASTIEVVDSNNLTIERVDIAYNADGRAVSSVRQVIDSQGVTTNLLETSFKYDEAGFLTEISYPNGLKGVIGRNQALLVTSLSLKGKSNGIFSTEFEYDDLARVVSVLNVADGVRNVYHFDAWGRLAGSLAESQDGSVSHDLGQLTRSYLDASSTYGVNYVDNTQGDKHVRIYFDAEVNPVQNTTRMTAEGGATPYSTTLYRYDELGRLVATSSPFFTGDASVVAIDAAQYWTERHYDLRGQLSAIIPPNDADGMVSVHFEDIIGTALGRRVDVGDTRHETIYEGNTLVQTVSSADQAISNTFVKEYDANAKALRSFDSAGNLGLITFDNMNLLSVQPMVGGGISYSYGLDSLLNRIESQGGRASQFDYDQFNRLNSLQLEIIHPNDANSKVTQSVNVQYGPVDHGNGCTVPPSRVAGIQGPNDAVMLCYDDLARVIKQTHFNFLASETLTWYYQYDHLARTSLIVQPDQSVLEYHYFPDGSVQKIESSAFSEPVLEVLSRDPFGRVTERKLLNTVETVTRNPISGVPLKYERNGNISSDFVWNNDKVTGVVSKANLQQLVVEDQYLGPRLERRTMESFKGSKGSSKIKDHEYEYDSLWRLLTPDNVEDLSSVTYQSSEYPYTPTQAHYKDGSDADLTFDADGNPLEWFGTFHTYHSPTRRSSGYKNQEVTFIQGVLGLLAVSEKVGLFYKRDTYFVGNMIVDVTSPGTKKYYTVVRGTDLSTPNGLNSNLLAIASKTKN